MKSKPRKLTPSEKLHIAEFPGRIVFQHSAPGKIECLLFRDGECGFPHGHLLFRFKILIEEIKEETFFLTALPSAKDILLAHLNISQKRKPAKRRKL